MLDQPASKTELLHHLRIERATLLAQVTGLRTDELEAPALAGGWAVKDVLAHISAWERRIVTAIEVASRGEVPHWPEAGASLADVDRLNSDDFATHRNDAVDSVLRESRGSYESALRIVENLGDAEVMGEPAWRPGVPLLGMIGANTWEHYREHIDQIIAWRTGGIA